MTVRLGKVQPDSRKSHSNLLGTLTLSFDKKSITILIGVIRGHYMLQRMGYSENNLGRSCWDQEESVQLFLCDCTADNILESSIFIICAI